MANNSTSYTLPSQADIEREKANAFTENNEIYDGAVADLEDLQNEHEKISNQWKNTQQKNQQAQTDFAIKEINQQKEQQKKDYLKEQSAAYVDWQKQSNQYGANAEQVAAQGMQNTGFAESSQVSMYNTYQNRITTAREIFNRASLNLDNAITNARLQNSSILAEIAKQAAQEQFEFAVQVVQHKNTLLSEKANRALTIEQLYDKKWQDVLAQINTENAQAEQKRQFNETMAFQREQFNWQKEQANKSGQITKTSSRGSYTSGNSKKNTDSDNAYIKNTNAKITGNNTKTNKGSNEPTVDMQSVIDLGYGPIGPERLNQLIAQGEVVEYRDGNKLKYKRTNQFVRSGIHGTDNIR